MNEKLKLLSPILLRSQLLENIDSFCPSCKKIINSEIVEIAGKVFLRKRCCNREMLYHLENDVDFFLKNLEIKRNIQFGKELDKINTYFDLLKNSEKDTHALNIYVTLRCNLNCPICYLKFDGLSTVGPRTKGYDLPLNVIKKVIDKTSAEIIIFTGGEPTLYPKLFQAIKYAKRRGKKVAILTNGLKLVDKKYLKKLVDAGIDKIGISFDGFDDYIYQLLRGKPLKTIKLKALRNLKKFNLKVVLVPVIAKNLNEDQIPKIIDFAIKNNKFIKQIVFTSLKTEKYSQYTTAPSDIVKIFSRFIDNFDVNDIHLWSKFSANLYKLIQRFLSGIIKEGEIREKLSFLLPRYDVLLKVEKGKVYPVFSREELKKINQILEKALASKTKMGSIITIIQNMKVFLKPQFSELILKWFSGRFCSGYDVLDKLDNLLRIHFDRVNSIHTHTLLDIEKVKNYPPVISTFI